jgi:hypothetical protein
MATLGGSDPDDQRSNRRPYLDPSPGHGHDAIDRIRHKGFLRGMRFTRYETMSQALAHFAFGMAMTTIVISVFRPSVRYTQTIAFFGGIWAMLPDVKQIIPQIEPWEHLYHEHWIANVFWFHQFLDTRVDPGDADLVVALMVLFLLITTVWAERRSYRRRDVSAGEK